MSSPVRTLSILLPLAPVFAAAQPTAETLLAACDAVRNPGVPFQVTLDLTEYRDQAQKGSTRIRVYARLNPERHQYDNLVRFLDPPAERSKLILKAGGEIWFFDRSTNAGVRLSAQQRLLGQASNGDVVTLNFARDYKPVITGEERIPDGDRKDKVCLKLALTAVAPDALYASIELWLEKGTGHPVKARFHSDSGRLLKTAYYRKYELQLGRMRPMETVIIDGMDPRWVTLMRFSDFRARAIPDAWLRRDGLPTFRD